MILKFRGKVWVFGDNLDVDKEIVPFRQYDSGILKKDQLGTKCMFNVDPEFSTKVKKGDIMVVGSNMGCGHDHVWANLAIKQCGVSCVIAESFDRNFFRNSIAIGLPIVECKLINQKVKEGDVVEVDLHAGKIKNLTNGQEIKFVPLPDFLLDIIEADGVDTYTDKLLAAE